MRCKAKALGLEAFSVVHGHCVSRIQLDHAKTFFGLFNLSKLQLNFWDHAKFVHLNPELGTIKAGLTSFSLGLNTHAVKLSLLSLLGPLPKN